MASLRHPVFFACCLLLASFCCLLLWTFGSLCDNSLHNSHNGKPLPAITEFCLRYRLAVLLFPLPWFAAAGRLGVRGRVTATELVVFSTTLVLTLLCLTVFLAVFFALPWVPLYL